MNVTKENITIDITAWALLALALLGCSLTTHLSNSLPPPTPRPLLSTQVLPGTPLPGCVVRAEWEIYTIVAGDTLSSLALRTNATVAELMTANCLSDPNLIQVGQTLVVPRPPDPITATPPPTATEG
jgi:hypothetical protein